MICVIRCLKLSLHEAPERAEHASGKNAAEIWFSLCARRVSVSSNLTGQLDSASADAAQAMLQDWIAPVLVQPFVIDRLAVAGEDRQTGQFHFIGWVPCKAPQTVI